MNKVLIRSAYFTDHNNKKTAVCLTVESNGERIERIVSSNETYGVVWLRTILKIVKALPELMEGNVYLSFISGQTQCALMAKKLERMYCQMLKTNTNVDTSVIKTIVKVDGKYKSLPNDFLYESVCEALWICKRVFNTFTLDQHYSPSSNAQALYKKAQQEAGKSSL